MLLKEVETVMGFEAKRVRLVPYGEEHLPLLHTWRNDQVFLANCTNRRETVDYEHFVDELETDFRRDRHKQFMVQRISDGRFIGTVYSYGFKKVDAYAFATIFMTEEGRRVGYGVEAMALFLEYLFKVQGLYKVYMEVYEYNASSLAVIQTAGFKEEGRFKDQRVRLGQRFDVIRYAAYHDDVIVGSILQRLRA